MVQDEVVFVLNTIEQEWPDSNSFRDDTVRIDRDDPRVLETSDRTKEWELSKDNVIAATLSSKPRTPTGTEFDYHVEATVTVRVEALDGSGDVFGHVDGKDDFGQLVDYARNAADQARSFPTVPSTDTVGKVNYHSMIVGESVEPDLSSSEDHYREDFECRLVGRQEVR
jgi:hypothetical protein